MTHPIDDFDVRAFLEQRHYFFAADCRGLLQPNKQFATKPDALGGVAIGFGCGERRLSDEGEKGEWATKQRGGRAVRNCRHLR